MRGKVARQATMLTAVTPDALAPKPESTEGM